MLILVRHGSYSLRTGKLDELGIQQAERAAECVRTLTKPVAILHSPSQRTIDTAAIIAERLHLYTQEDVQLSEQGKAQSFLPPIQDSSPMVLVTHLPVLRTIIHAWSIHLGVDNEFDIPVGSVVLIDLLDRQIQRIA